MSSPVGDAVISFFPGYVNNNSKHHASDMSVECGKSMINAIKEDINVILHKIYDILNFLSK
jgi:hypothetical protein